MSEPRRTGIGYAVTIHGRPHWWLETSDRRDAAATRLAAERDAEYLRCLRPLDENAITVVECARPEGFA